MGIKPELYSFGPAFPGDETRIHDADEGINTENFWKHAQICLQAVKIMSE